MKKITAKDSRQISLDIALAKLDNNIDYKVVEGESIYNLDYFHPDRDMGETQFVVVGDKVLPYYKKFKYGRLMDNDYNYHCGDFIILSSRKAIDKDCNVIYYKSFEGKWDFLDKDI